MWASAALLFFLQAPDYIAEGLQTLDAAKYSQAAELFGKAVAADPNDYAAHFHLALSYTMLKRDADSLAEYKKVLELKPGITGLWQVSGRSRTGFDDMVRLDLQYARTWSPWLDVKILLQTPLAVLRADGAH